MISLSPDQLTQDFSELGIERLGLIQGVCSEFSDLAKLAKTEPGDVAAHSDLLAAVAGAWAQLLSDHYVQQMFPRVPIEHEDIHWLTSSLLLNARTICRKIRDIMLARTGNGDVENLILELLRGLSEAVRRSEHLHVEGPVGIQHTAEVIRATRRSLDLIDTMIAERRNEEARDLVENLKEQGAEGTQALDALKRASGAVGDVQMASFYATMAQGETESANRFRGWTVAFVVSGGIAGLGFLFLPPDFLFPVTSEADRYIRLIQKAIAVAGLFGIGAYMSRQAHQHRTLANWARSLAVQLQTLDAYLAAIANPDIKDELRKTFAIRAFGDHPAMKGDPQPAESSTVDAAIGLLTKIMPGQKSGA